MQLYRGAETAIPIIAEGVPRGQGVFQHSLPFFYGRFLSFRQAQEQQACAGNTVKNMGGEGLDKAGKKEN